MTAQSLWFDIAKPLILLPVHKPQAWFCFLTDRYYIERMDVDLKITPQDFPELRLLVWNRDPASPIAAEDAFRIYERNWRHVAKAQQPAQSAERRERKED